MRAIWGKQATKLAERDSRRYTGHGLPADDSEDRVKYMEDYLRKDKKYIPYDQKEKYAKFLQQKHSKQRESAENLKPILIIIAIIVIGYFISTQAGIFNLP